MNLDIGGKSTAPGDVGALHIGCLSAPATVWRDEWGIPHIRAATSHDAFVALGVVHAQDRLWQMDALRRRITGRYAEWMGPSALAGDILARQLDGAGASQRDYAALGREARAMLDAYARGVNAFIGLGEWGEEYRLLGGEPEPWEPWHGIAAMRQISFLMGSVWMKLWRAAALPIVGAEQIGKLRADSGGPERLCIPPGADMVRVAAALEDLAPGIAALLAEAAPDVSGGGSNNWALAPSRTGTGRPLLAGDPHRVLEMPNMYYQTHLACDEFDVIGLTVPGVPGFPHYGHTPGVAWCVTHAFVDIHDLYVERFAQGGGAYEFKDEWRPTTTRIEEIAVRGAAPTTIEVVETHHGPVVAGDPATGHAITMRSVQFAEPDISFDCMVPMMRSMGVNELFAATREWGLIDHNLVAADTNGHIGHLVRAKIPVRSRANGWLPVPGWTGAHEWDGIIPWEDMPRSNNPAIGAIVTANNRVAGEGEHYLCTDCLPPHRARRIWDRLGELDAPDVADMQAIHGDLLSLAAPVFQERLRLLRISDPATAALRDRLVAWSGRMDGAASEPGLYVAFRRALTQLVAERSGLTRAGENPCAQVGPGIVAVNQLWWTVPELLRDNDAGLLGGASWEELLLLALTQATSPPEEAWATIHTRPLIHPLSSAYPEAAPRLDMPCAPVGGDNDTVFATGYNCAAGPGTVYASLCRYVYDVGEWDNSQWIVFHGASGHPGSPWYKNQNAAWSRGELVPMLYDWDVIAANGAAQVLRPNL
jgi:penicillin amidase